MFTKYYSIVGKEFLLEESEATESAVAAINSAYESLANTNPDMDETSKILYLVLQAEVKKHDIPSGAPSTRIMIKVIIREFTISTTEQAKTILKQVEKDLDKRYLSLLARYPDKSTEELSRIMLLQMYLPS